MAPPRQTHRQRRREPFWQPCSAQRARHPCFSVDAALHQALAMKAAHGNGQSAQQPSAEGDRHSALERRTHARVVASSHERHAAAVASRRAVGGSSRSARVRSTVGLAVAEHSAKRASARARAPATVQAPHGREAHGAHNGFRRRQQALPCARQRRRGRLARVVHEVRTVTGELFRHAVSLPAAFDNRMRRASSGGAIAQRLAWAQILRHSAATPLPLHSTWSLRWSVGTVSEHAARGS